MMEFCKRNNGSVMVIAVFTISLLTILVVGMLQINTEEIIVMRNQEYITEAIYIAEAGLNDAFYELRYDDEWDDGFNNKSYAGGSYDVTVSGEAPTLEIVSEGTSKQDFTARVEADITIGSTYPYVIRVDELRINE